MKENDPDPYTGLAKKLPETLPEGYAWGYYAPGSGIKSFVYKMFCTYCGVGASHMNEDCPKKGTPEAAEFLRQHLPVIFADETKPKIPK